MFFQPWALIIGAPAILVYGYLFVRLARQKVEKKTPFTESLLRPPGETCRLKLEQLDEELTFQAIYGSIPVVFAIALFFSGISKVSCIALSVMATIYAFYAAKRISSVIKSIRDYDLGFKGERAVGQELNQLLSQGYRVYHDLQFNGFNIDHVIVGPSGVYAVETKARRKGLSSRSHVVTYDGQKLTSPEWKDSRGLEQAQRNAKDLSNWLSKAIGESICAVPILTLPGWYVEGQGGGPISVLNPKQINGFVTRKPPVFTQQIIQRISYQLEQKSVWIEY